MSSIQQNSGQNDKHSPDRTRYVRIGPLINVPAQLEKLGADSRSVLDTAGVGAEQLRSSDLIVPFLMGDRLLFECSRRTSCNHFGLLLGQQFGLHHIGVAGFLAQAAPDLATALQSLVEFLVLTDEGGSLTLTVQSDYAFLEYVVHQPGLLAVEQLSDMTMAASFVALRSLCGSRWRPHEVWLSRPKPCDEAPYRNFFPGRVVYNSPQNAIVFHSKWLNHPLATANPELFRYLGGIAKAAMKDIPENELERLRNLLRLQLGSRNYSLDSVAASLGVHPRTLNRKLQAMGTTFRFERDRVRRDTALQLLRSTRIPVAEVAHILGYKDCSTFDHAFKRWCDVTPVEWREQNRSNNGNPGR